jgi:hypothetical protein
MDWEDVEDRYDAGRTPSGMSLDHLRELYDADELSNFRESGNPFHSGYGSYQRSVGQISRSAQNFRPGHSRQLSRLIRNHPFFKIPLILVTLFMTGILVVMLLPKAPRLAFLILAGQVVYIIHKVVFRRSL